MSENGRRITSIDRFCLRREKKEQRGTEIKRWKHGQMKEQWAIRRAIDVLRTKFENTGRDRGMILRGNKITFQIRTDIAAREEQLQPILSSHRKRVEWSIQDGLFSCVLAHNITRKKYSSFYNSFLTSLHWGQLIQTNSMLEKTEDIEDITTWLYFSKFRTVILDLGHQNRNWTCFKNWHRTHSFSNRNQNRNQRFFRTHRNCNHSILRNWTGTIKKRNRKRIMKPKPYQNQ